MGNSRLYIVTRRDLKKGLKIAQACHVALESPKRFPLLTQEKEIPYVIILEVEDEERLDVLRKEATKQTVVVTFREPDLDNQLTSIAFLGSNRTRSLTEGLHLAG
jgi:peptidyl-tRNA hydrolase